MKRTEEEKKMICQVLDEWATGSHLSLHQFKKDNDLLPVDKCNKWLVNEDYPEWLGYYCTKTKNRFGIDINGTIFNLTLDGFDPNEAIFNTFITATPEQVQERLTKCAIKMGYGERQSECLSGWHKDERSEWLKGDITFTFEAHTNRLWIDGLNFYSLCIFKNGIWAKFLPTECEKIEEEIKKLQAKLNKLKDYRWIRNQYTNFKK